MVTATDILGEFRGGSSLPVLVATRQGPCVVKWRGAGDGPVTNGVDWICLHLAGLLGIPVPRPRIVQVERGLISKTRDPELRDLIRASLGINLGLEYVDGTRPYTPKDLESVPSGLRDLIFVFDLLLFNIDRININPNLLLARDRLYAIDYSAAMEIKRLIAGQMPLPDSLLPRLRQHPFFTPDPRAEISLDRHGRDELARAVARTPPDWLGLNPDRAGQIRSVLAQGVYGLVCESRSLTEARLAQLRNLPLPTPSQERIRCQNNRDRFFQKAGLK